MNPLLLASRVVVFAAMVSLSGVVASAESTVYLKFYGNPPPMGSGPTQAEKDAIKAGLEAKFGFVPNLRFVIGDPPDPLARNQFVVGFPNTQPAPKEWGVASPATREAVVNRGKLLPGAQWDDQFDTQEKRVRGLVNIATHELGHLFGCEHNCHAPNDTRVLRAGGEGVHRTPGDGMLVEGAPGVMCDGHKVHADEIATTDMKFTTGTGGEQGIIQEFIRRIKAGLTPTGRPGPTVNSLNPEFIEGLRPNMESGPPVPPWDNPPSPSRLCQYVDLHLFFANNLHWDFGYMTESGFFPLILAGTPDAMFSYRPGAPVDLAVQDVSVLDGPVRRMTQHGQVLNLGQQLPPNESVFPMVTQPYFRQAAFAISTHDQGMTPPVFIQLSFSPYPDMSDGLRMVPWFCPGDFDEDGAVGVPDIFAFLAAWFAMDPSADIDGDMQVGVPDIFAFLSLWFATCS